MKTKRTQGKAYVAPHNQANPPVPLQSDFKQAFGIGKFSPDLGMHDGLRLGLLPNEPKKSHEISYIRFACCFLIGGIFLFRTYAAAFFSLVHRNFGVLATARDASA